MHVRNPNDVTKPLAFEHGETIAELIGRVSGEGTDRHSIAHVTVPPGKASLRHYHIGMEESYTILAGEARMEMDGETRMVGSGDAILIPERVHHKIVNTGDDDLRLLCACAPAYSNDHTVFVETWKDGRAVPVDA